MASVEEMAAAFADIDGQSAEDIKRTADCKFSLSTYSVSTHQSQTEDLN